MVTLAALVRVATPLLAPAFVPTAMATAQTLWLLAFGGLLAGLGPMLLRPRVDGAPG
ncbi:MAG: NnrS family protein [Thiohalorhabdus sp.]|uniref:NnrS family protein n=1 Tax=Thiohalorhabdus sp. TaxID=3094134 RepID=UPI00397FA80A